MLEIFLQGQSRSDIPAQHLGNDFISFIFFANMNDPDMTEKVKNIKQSVKSQTGVKKP